MTNSEERVSYDATHSSLTINDNAVSKSKGSQAAMRVKRYCIDCSRTASFHRMQTQCG